LPLIASFSSSPLTPGSLTAWPLRLSSTSSSLSHLPRLSLLSIHSSRVQIKEVNDDDWSDSSSVASDVELDDEEDSQLALYDPSQETLRERFAALKDIIPPTTRASIADSIAQAKAYTKWSVGKVGTAAWITCTSALLVGLPLLLSIEGEAAIVQQEKEFMAQVRALSRSFFFSLPPPIPTRADFSRVQPGAPNPYGAPPVGGAPAAPSGVVPSGF
jgi:import receptor subunit TOM22